jgi:DNA polymerase-3 subunit epsilon
MKSFYFDTETGGLDPKHHALLQIAWIIENDDNEIVVERSFDLAPEYDADINLPALDVNGFTIERIKEGTPRAKVLETMRQDVKSAVGGGGPLIPIGHNVRFDIDFLYRAAQRGTETFWLNFGNNDYLALRKPVCTLALSNYLSYCGMINVSDHKLITMCNYFSIPVIDAHDALADVRMTRHLFHALKRRITC